MKTPALDLTRYHFKHERGDITVFGTWFRENFSLSYPCLAVVPTNRMTWMTCEPMVIPLHDAWRWNPEDPDASPEMAARMIDRFCIRNGFDTTNQYTKLRLLTVIHDHLGDLVRMPPRPGEMIVVADVLETDPESGIERHREIISRE